MMGCRSFPTSPKHRDMASMGGVHRCRWTPWHKYLVCFSWSVESARERSASNKAPQISTTGSIVRDLAAAMFKNPPKVTLSVRSGAAICKVLAGWDAKTSP
jgi:hypothetical protein